MRNDNRSSILLDVAVKIQKILKNESILIGGVALGMWGVARMTGDVDFASGLPGRKILELFAEIGIPVEMKTGDPTNPVPWVVQGRLDDTEGGSVPFQILPCLHGIRIENGVYSPDGTLKVVGFDDLVRSKFGAGGPQDILDVARLALAYPHKLVSIRNRAETCGLAETFDRHMESDRLRSQQLKFDRK